jgi:HAD superfamily hydrolase (TIGR01509 family)
VLLTTLRSHLSAILYDLDGTLANTDPVHSKAWKECLLDFGIEIDEAFYARRMTGRLNPDIVADMLPQLTLEEGIEVADRKEARFRELAEHLMPMDGLRRMIAWANEQGLRQAVVTNAPRPNVDFMLNVLGLEHTFEQVIVSEEIGVGKPDPGPYLWVLREFGLEGSSAIAFEDSPSGIRSAVAAGIATIGIASTQKPPTLYEVGAALVIENFTSAELWQILEFAPVGSV